MQPPPYGSAPYGGLRPLGVGEILDNTIQVYRKNFRALVTMVAVVVVPLQVVSVLINLSSRPSANTTNNTTIGGFTFSSSSSTDGHDAAVRFTAAIVVLLLAVIAGWLAVGACTRGVSDAYIGGVKADAGASLRVFGRNLISLSWLVFLALPPIIVGSAFCFVPGIWLWVSWLVAIPALVIEGQKGTHALGRSFRLVRGRRWPILGLAVLASLLAEVVRTSFVVVLIGVLLRSHSTASTEYIVAAGVIGAISSLLTTPLISTAYVILYFDLRVRSEGLDLQLVLDNLDSPAVAPAPYPVPPPFAPPPFAPPPFTPPPYAPPPPSPPPPPEPIAPPPPFAPPPPRDDPPVGPTP